MQILSFCTCPHVAARGRIFSILLYTPTKFARVCPIRSCQIDQIWNLRKICDQMRYLFIKFDIFYDINRDATFFVANVKFVQNLVKIMSIFAILGPNLDIILDQKSSFRWQKFAYRI